MSRDEPSFFTGNEKEKSRVRSKPTLFPVIAAGGSRTPPPSASRSRAEQAQGSAPFQSRQFLRWCASFTLSKSKYSSQYGRSSASGLGQKQVSTQCAAPSAHTRACCIS